MPVFLECEPCQLLGGRCSKSREKQSSPADLADLVKAIFPRLPTLVAVHSGNRGRSPHAIGTSEEGVDILETLVVERYVRGCSDARPSAESGELSEAAKGRVGSAYRPCRPVEANFASRVLRSRGGMSSNTGIEEAKTEQTTDDASNRRRARRVVSMAALESSLFAAKNSRVAGYIAGTRQQ
jgi:hypothetical protein